MRVPPLCVCRGLMYSEWFQTTFLTPFPKKGPPASMSRQAEMGHHHILETDRTDQILLGSRTQDWTIESLPWTPLESVRPSISVFYLSLTVSQHVEWYLSGCSTYVSTTLLFLEKVAVLAVKRRKHFDWWVTSNPSQSLDFLIIGVGCVVQTRCLETADTAGDSIVEFVPCT